MKNKRSLQKGIAILILAVSVACIGLGGLGLMQRGTIGDEVLENMRLRALLANTGEGATEALVTIAKKDAVAKAKADGKKMAEIKELSLKAEEEARAKAGSSDVDLTQIDATPIREAVLALEAAQKAYHLERDAAIAAYLATQQAAASAETVQEEAPQTAADAPLEGDGMEDAMLEEPAPTVTLEGFQDTEAMLALSAVVDERYTALGKQLQLIFPELDNAAILSLKQSLLQLIYTDGDDFEAKFDRFATILGDTQVENTSGFRMWMLRNAGNIIVLGIGMLLLGLIVLFYQRIVQKLGLPRLIIGFFFIILCLASVVLNLNLSSLLTNTLVRVGMNAVLVLAMVPGIQCGISLNLGLPIGIIGGLLGGLLCIECGFSGLLGFLFAIAVGVVIAIIFGYLYALLLNRLKGSEMAVTTYVGYSVVSLMCIGWLVLPFQSIVMRWPLGKGLRVTINLATSYRKLLDQFLSFEIFGVTVPTGLLLFVGFMCLLMWIFTRSKTGIAMQAAGNNPRFAQATGINVDKMRIIGTVLSTVLGAIGIIVYSQSYGFMQLYTAPRQLGFIAASAILIGGASTSRAKISNVLIGTLLFQGVLTLGMPVANQLVPQSTLSETMRILISNGIILYALTKSGGDSRA